MDMHTVVTHVLTYLAALALPLWLLGEQLAAWWTFRKLPIEKREAKAHLKVVDDAETVRKAA